MNLLLRVIRGYIIVIIPERLVFWARCQRQDAWLRLRQFSSSLSLHIHSTQLHSLQYTPTSKHKMSAAKRMCIGVSCINPSGTLQCPTCLKLGKESFFCSQDCFKNSWVRSTFFLLFCSFAEPDPPPPPKKAYPSESTANKANNKKADI